LQITNNIAFSSVKDADIVYFPALWRNPFPVIQRNRAVVDWLIDLYEHSDARLVGVGTGCCFLAEAALLDGRIATTHWYFFERFKKRYPQVNLQQNYFITQSDRIYCTGSVNTLADLSVHFLEEYYGSGLSAEVERHFFHDIRQNYKKLALVENLSRAHYDELILEAQAMMQSRVYEAFDVNNLANQLGMSRRNLDRRFKAATGSTPLRYMQGQKMECARDLIKNSNLSINEIMYKVGYQDPSHFSALFKQQHGTTPRQYRNCLLYTSDAADDLTRVHSGSRRTSIQHT